MDRCKDCKFFRKLKEFENRDWIIKSCCTLFPQTYPNDGYDSFVLVVDETDMCECFEIGARKSK